MHLLHLEIKVDNIDEFRRIKKGIFMTQLPILCFCIKQNVIGFYLQFILILKTIENNGCIK